MSTGIIIAIVVVVAIVVFALLLAAPRMRVLRRERELQERRTRLAGEHRQEAESRAERAEAAEQRARIAEAEAQRERAEAQLHQERANVHEQGLADHELVQEHERDRFAGTSAVPERGARDDADAELERDNLAARDRVPADRGAGTRIRDEDV